MYAAELPVGKVIHQKLQHLAGARSEMLERVKDTARQIENVFKTDKEQLKLFNDFVIESTDLLVDVDHKDGRERYSKYWLDYTETVGGKDVERHLKFDNNAQREKAKKALGTNNNVPSDSISTYGGVGADLQNFDRLKKKYWDKLGDPKDNNNPQKNAYRKLRNAYSDALTRLQEAIGKRIDDITNDVDQRGRLKTIIFKQLLDKATLEPYFPFHREGSNWLEWLDVEERSGQVVLYKRPFNTKLEADLFADSLRRDEARVEAVRKSRKGEPEPEEVVEYNSDERITNFIDEAKAVPTQFAGKLVEEMDKLNLQGTNADAYNALFDVLLSAMPERSIAKSLGKTREGTLGFEEDALTAFRKKMPNFLSQVMRLENENEMRDLSEQVKKEVSTYTDGDGDSKVAVR